MFQAMLVGQGLKVLKWLAIGTGIFFVYRAFRAKAKEKGYMKNDEGAATDLAKIQAISLRQAMNPSGEATLFDVDGTTTSAIMQTATEIKDLQAVINAYNERFKGSLLHHLELEIGAEELKRFSALAGGASNGGANYSVLKTGVSKRHLVRTTKDCNARSTPKKKGYFEHSNILKTFKPYNYIGTSTGKTEYDSANDIIFLEVDAENSKRQKVTFWVAKSQVELISKDDFIKRKKTENVTVERISGITALPEPEIGTVQQTMIYDELMQPEITMQKHTRLGVPGMLLKVKNKLFVRFTSPDGKRRWVDAKDIVLFIPQNA